eukprot:9222734-Pyramimonas_sp.AAC.1
MELRFAGRLHLGVIAGAFGGNFHDSENLGSVGVREEGNAYHVSKADRLYLQGSQNRRLSTLYMPRTTPWRRY